MLFAIRCQLQNEPKGICFPWAPIQGYLLNERFAVDRAYKPLEEKKRRFLDIREAESAHICELSLG